MSSRDEETRRLLDRGLTHYGLGQVQQAIKIWNRVLAMDPDNPRAREYLQFVKENWRASHSQPPEPYRPGAGSVSPQQSRAVATSSVDGVFSQPPAKPAEGPGNQSAQVGRLAKPAGGWAQDPAAESALALVSGADPGEAQAPASRSDVEVLLAGAKEMLELDDFSGAIDLLDKVLQRTPEHPEAGKLRERAEVELRKIFRSKLGGLDRVPTVRMSGDEIIWLSLDHRAGFVLSLVDGQTSYEDILSVCGLPELDGLRILVQLLQEKVIDVQ